MDALILLAAIVAALAAFDVAVMRVGVDSRTWTRDGRPMSIVG
jgi:hypothetical protein